jgi:hypothetical protein
MHAWLVSQPRTLYSEAIKQTVWWWTKCIVKQEDYVEKLCSCKISALVSINMKHTVWIIIDSLLYLWDKFRDFCWGRSCWMLLGLTSGKLVSSECTITNVDAGRSSMTSCCFILFFSVISVRLWSRVKLHVQSKVLGQQRHFWKYAWFVVCRDVRARWYTETDLCVMKRSLLVWTWSFSFCTDMRIPVWPQTRVSRLQFEFLSLTQYIIENFFKIPISRPTDATCNRFLFSSYMFITLHVSSFKRSSSGVPRRSKHVELYTYR